MTPALRVDRIGKRYVLGGVDPRGSLRARVAAASFVVARALRGHPVTATPQRRIWAMRDVSFELAPGEVLGIVGGNGSGKSTLLKVLSRITDPTEGRAQIRGRVGSLLGWAPGFTQSSPDARTFF